MNVFNVTDTMASFTTAYPSEVWWRSKANCIGVAVREWDKQCKEADLDVEMAVITIKLDSTHPNRFRLVGVYGSINNIEPHTTPGFDPASA